MDQPQVPGQPRPKLSDEPPVESPQLGAPGVPGDTNTLGNEVPPDLVPLKGLTSAPLENSTPAQYQLRSKELREQAVEQFGGNAESEAAVDLALHWLASIQNVDVYWDDWEMCFRFETLYAGKLPKMPKRLRAVRARQVVARTR